jgi:hypothetical protein
VEKERETSEEGEEMEMESYHCRRSCSLCKKLGKDYEIYSTHNKSNHCCPSRKELNSNSHSEGGVETVSSENPANRKRKLEEEREQTLKKLKQKEEQTAKRALEKLVKKRQQDDEKEQK